MSIRVCVCSTGQRRQLRRQLSRGDVISSYPVRQPVIFCTEVRIKYAHFGNKSVQRTLTLSSLLDRYQHDA
jgi:hypothetical protein